MALLKDYVVSITDDDDNTVAVAIKFVNAVHNAGTWRALSMGAIRYNSGSTQERKSLGTVTTYHLELVSHGSWGIRLNDFEDMWSVNDEGSGYLVQPWVLSLRPGRISWSLVGS
jgi:hypothetical protein